MTNLLETFSEANQKELTRLRSLLQISQNCFSLGMVTYSSLALRDVFINILKAENSELIVVSVQSATRSILEQTQPKSKSLSPFAIFITDLETIVKNEKTNLQLIYGLNAERENWKEQYSCPVIFWMPEFLTTLVANKARDLWSWVSHRFDLAEEPALRIELDTLLDRSDSRLTLIDGLSYKEKIQRISVLQDQLQKAKRTKTKKVQPDLYNRLMELANIHYSMAQYKNAEQCLTQVLAIAEKSFGTDHSKTSTVLNNLAQLLLATNRLTEAEPMLRRVITILENPGGEPLPNYAGSLNNLAQLLQATNRLAEAELLMKRALSIDEKSFGPDHTTVATRLNNLAQLLQDTNRIEEAETLMKRALAIDEKSYGPDHPKVATNLNNLAQLLKATNHLAEAEPLMKRALSIDEKSYGPDHPDVARDLNNLARLLQDTNRLAEAEPLMKRALDIDENSFGPDHPDVAVRLNNLALLFRSTNRLAEAKPLMKRALDISEKSLGLDHPNTITFRNNLENLSK